MLFEMRTKESPAMPGFLIVQ